MDALVSLSLLAGLAVGALAAWVVARGQFRRELAESISTHQATVSAAQALFHQTTRRLGEVQAELTRLRDDLERSRIENTVLKEELARVNTELSHQEQEVPKQLALLDQAQAQLRDSFQALAGAALKSSNEEFLKLAAERMSGLHKDAATEISRKQAAFDELVTPIRDVLLQVDLKLGEVEKNRMETGAEISSLLEAIGRSQTQLRAETTNLVRALRTPTVRGRWGEMQLRRVVEMAGMLEYCDFDEQASHATENGRVRPDLLVRLPGGRTVVIDAKAPLEAYLDAQEAPDEQTRERKLADHSRQVRDHMTKLGAKGYWEQFHPSPEFVVMFLPGEAVFQAALQQDAHLIEFGVGTQVFPASPLTLIALLRAVAHGWRQERLTRNAEQVSKLGKELYDRVRHLTDRMETLRGRLDGTVRAFNDTVATYEGRVLVTARRFRDLGAATGDEIGAVGEVDTTPRSPQGVARLFLAHGNGDAGAGAEPALDHTDRPPDQLAPAVAGNDR
ncbi:MAG TPA: DNA recombination protein RmuC [Vicinamibacterales bacterium]|nr:DNA recombination protein RmuC [Vicinamibacterales bacterium]